MKIYVGHSKKLNYKKEIYQPIKNCSLFSEHEFIFPHEIYTEASDFITKDIIKTCDVMIAEVTYPATGLGIELGWADSFECPIICIFKKGHKTSGSLKVVSNRFYEYIDENDLVNKIQKALEQLRS